VIRARIRLDNGDDLIQQRESERYSIGLSQPLIVSANEWLEALGRIYMVKDRTDYQWLGAPRQMDSETNVRALSFEVDWRKAEARRLRIVSGGVYQGLDHFGARSNAGHDLDFLRLRLSGCRATTSPTVGRAWPRRRVTGAMTACPTVSGWCSAGRTTGVATP
jgi:hypothetical protein